MPAFDRMVPNDPRALVRGRICQMVARCWPSWLIAGLALTGTAWGGEGPTPPAVEEATQTIWDGVYSADQADAGQAAYFQACVACHGLGLTGGLGAPGIIGATFDDKYADQPLLAYFDYLSTRMPVDRPGQLPPEQYADILAFILSAHGAPAGEEPLLADRDTLADILIVVRPE